MFKSGFAAVIGRPNVGKSTLINSLIGEKLLIVSDKPQATRNKIRCILNTENAQVIFLDTPGIHKPRHGLGKYMLKTALDAIEEVDVLLFVVEAHQPPGPGDRHIADLLTKTDTPAILVLNKIDLLKDDSESIKVQYELLAPFKETIEVSSKTRENVEKLIQAVISLLPPGPRYYPEDVIVDQPERFVAAELIREKILGLTREEIPHSVAVTVEEMR
ncbi:MAG TPA: GTPase Era, partial [Firmicutes bacterium]|nr:GTPase Era [Bacillota bacterium]